MAGRDHLLGLPAFVLAFRILQLVTALAIMGLAAYGITFLSFDGIDLTLFTAIATLIISIYIIVAETGAPIIYNYWAILGLDIFAIVFWLISFALLASEVAAYHIVTYTTDDCVYEYAGVCYYKRARALETIAKRATTNVYTYRNAMAAASGLGGLEFIFFIVTLVMTSIWLHRHRQAGGHCTPARANAAQGVPGQKSEMPAQQQPQGYPAQQQPQMYPVQPQTYPAA